MVGSRINFRRGLRRLGIVASAIYWLAAIANVALLYRSDVTPDPYAAMGTQVHGPWEDYAAKPNDGAPWEHDPVVPSVNPDGKPNYRNYTDAQLLAAIKATTGTPKEMRERDRIVVNLAFRNAAIRLGLWAAVYAATAIVLITLGWVAGGFRAERAAI